MSNNRVKVANDWKIELWPEPVKTGMQVGMPKVLNKYKDVDVGVYIGRPSIWGNPFVIGKDGNRDQVIEKYKNWLLSQPDLVTKVKQQLKGHNLVCFVPLKNVTATFYCILRMKSNAERAARSLSARLLRMVSCLIWR